MLCSDGFRHELSADEIMAGFRPDEMNSDAILARRSAEMIEQNKQRGEKDNISVVAFKAFSDDGTSFEILRDSTFVSTDEVIY
jgi:serine/threonine protein phosphatase PrpC